MKEKIKPPKHIADEAIRLARKSESYQKLAAAYSKLMLNKQFIQASMLHKQMKKIEDELLKKVSSIYTNEQMRVEQVTASMSEEDRIKMNTLAHALMMMADVIEVSVSELNGIMSKYFNNQMRIVSFDKLQELSTESKRLVAYFDETRKEEYNTTLFGISCDSLYEMIFNKAKSYCTKVNHHRNMITK